MPVLKYDQFRKTSNFYSRATLDSTKQQQETPFEDMSAQGSHFQTMHAKSQFTFKTKVFDAFSTQNRPAGLDVGASHGGFETAASDINTKFFQVRASKSQLADLRPATNHGPSRNYASYIRRVNRLPVKTPMTYQLKAPYSLKRSAKPSTA